MIFLEENKNIAPEIIPLTELNPAVGLVSWANQQVQSIDISHLKDKSVWLFSVKNNTMSQVLEYTLLGATVYPPQYIRYYDPNRGKYTPSFVFVDRCLDLNSLSEENRKRTVTWTLVHELGHARGTYMDSGYPFPGDITDGDHIGGHNGTYTGLCCMRFAGNDSDPNYTPDQHKKTLQNLGFCFGHLQMLHNCTFNEE